MFNEKNVSKTVLFEFLTQGTSIPSNYIYFTKTTNEWIISDIIRPFENLEMLILEIKHLVSSSLLLRSLHGQKISLREL